MVCRGRKEERKREKETEKDQGKSRGLKHNNSNGKDCDLRCGTMSEKLLIIDLEGKEMAAV